MLVANPAPSLPAIVQLRNQLDAFYRTTKVYQAFNRIARNDLYYNEIGRQLDEVIARRGSARVLEVGAGCTNFPQWLDGRRSKVHFAAQDVTPANLDYLQGISDRVYIGDVSEIQERFDLVISTFVFEHVASPGAWLEQVDRLLEDGGYHALFCPRYDMPGYVCPSLRHLRGTRLVRVSSQIAAARLKALVGRKSAFLVNLDPSMFHSPWYRDSDAVHLVSKWDVTNWHRARGYNVRTAKLPAENFRLWIHRRLLLVSLVCQKPQRAQ